VPLQMKLLTSRRRN